MYICVTWIQKNILCLGNSVKRALTSVVGLSCLPRLATVVMIWGSSKGSYVKVYLVIFCMHIICRFHLHLRRGDIPRPVVSSPSMGANIPRDATCVLATNLCVLCFMLWLVSVCSHIFIPSWAGRCPRWPWMGLRSFFSVYGGWYIRGLLCMAFIFVYFSIGFIWKDGSNIVSSLLVILRAIVLFVTNFSGRASYVKVCNRFYLMSFYFWLLWF